MASSEAAANAARYDHRALRAFARAVFERCGLAAPDAELAADTLVSADLRGVSSHGLVRLPVYVRNLQSGAVDARARPEVVAESAATALVDGRNALGQVVSAFAMAVAIAKARTAGAGVVSVRRSNHFGAAAYYALQALEHGMIGLALTNGAPVMAPWGGITPLLGNNPFAVAVPARAAFPVVLDMANTVVARGWIKLAALRGESLPAGWALDARGRPTTDPNAALDGSLMPVGGYKGYGLAVIVELLAGALAGAALGPELENMGFTAGTTSAARPVEPSPGSVGGTGHLFLAIAVERFLPLDEFTARVDWLARLLKSSELAEGSTGVLLPGEREWLTEQRRRVEGIPLEASVAADLRRLADELQAAFPEPVAA